MSVTHSPTHSNSSLSNAGSQPDLPSISANAELITVRRRKKPEAEKDFTKELADFRAEIMTFLNEFRTSNDEKLSGMNDNIVDLDNKITSITASMKNLSSEHNKLKTELSKVTESVNFLSNSHDDWKSKVSSMTKDVIELKKTKSELTECKSQLMVLQKEHNLQQQRDRLNNLEISGIPINKNEVLSEYLKQICCQLGVQLAADDIIHIHRVPTRLPNRPKNIIVKLQSQLVKDRIISAIRKNKGLTTSDIGLPGDGQRIYINEHLIPYYKKLYKQAREAATQFGYAYVWIRNGKIFMRKNDTSPSIIITDYVDLNKVK